MRKGLFSLMLVILLALSVVPVYATSGPEATYQGEGSLSDAISNAAAGTTIKLGSNVDLSAAITISKEITLDLNGFTITSSAGDVFKITENGNFTITDSSSDNSGKITGPESVSDDIFDNKGTLNINGGTLTGNCSWGIIYNTGNLNISGGVVENKNSEKYSLINTSNGKVTISGGTIRGGQGFNVNTGEVKITGGTISGEFGIIVRRSASLEVDGEDVTIEGTVGDGISTYEADGQSPSVVVEKGTIKGAKYGIISNGSTTLTIEGGDIMSTSTVDEVEAEDPQWHPTGVVIHGEGGTVNITGGTISGIRGLELSEGNSTVNIEGGSFQGTEGPGLFIINNYSGKTTIQSADESEPTFASNGDSVLLLTLNGNVEINGGIFGNVKVATNPGEEPSDKNVEINDGVFNGLFIYTDEKPTTTIKGGEFKGEINSSNEKFIQGGVFDNKVEDEYIAEGYRDIEIDDKYYIVDSGFGKITFDANEGQVKAYAQYGEINDEHDDIDTTKTVGDKELRDSFVVFVKERQSDNIDVTENVEPTRLGYKFDGWYLDDVMEYDLDGVAQKGPKFIWGTKGIYRGVGRDENNPILDVELTAKWTPVKYNIKYYLNGGSYSEGTNPRKYNIESPTINLKSPIQDNYEFLGWYILGGERDGEKVDSIPTGSTGDLVLNARWREIKYDDITTTSETWIKGSTGSLLITFQRNSDPESTYNKWKEEVYVDGKLLIEGTDYEATSGSLKIELKDTFLNSLDLGEHKLTVGFTDLTYGVSTTFKVIPKSTPATPSYEAPKTGIE